MHVLYCIYNKGLLEEGGEEKTVAVTGLLLFPV